MPFLKRPDASENDRKILSIFTVFVIILGIVAFLVAFRACHDESLITVDRLARYNLGFEGAFVFTIKKCAEFAAIAGVSVAILAIIGLIGTRQDSKQLTCVYNVGLIVNGIVMFALGVHALGRQSEMAPVITRQVHDFCVEPTFIRLTQQLACANTAGPLAIADGQAPAPCNAICQGRVTTLSRTGEGCALLTGLCNNFAYTPTSAGLVTFSQPYFSASHVVVPTAERCERKCDHDMLCTGFQYTATSCLIKSTNSTRYVAGSWTIDTTPASGITTPVQLKGENAVLLSFTTFGYGVAVLLLVIGLALVVMWLLTMRILYNQNFNRLGKPTAHHVGLMLCCPCCADEDEYKKPQTDDGTDCDPEEPIRG